MQSLRWQLGRSCSSRSLTQQLPLHRNATMVPRQLAALQWCARQQHGAVVRRSYAIKAGRRRRKGGTKHTSGPAAAPSTQDARSPQNSLGTNFSGQTPAPAVARPDAFETAEHALQTLRRVYVGIKDMESSNEGMVVVSFPSCDVLICLSPTRCLNANAHRVLVAVDVRRGCWVRDRRDRWV